MDIPTTPPESSPAVDRVTRILEETKTLNALRPPETLLLRDATAPQMFQELAARIGAIPTAKENVWMVHTIEKDGQHQHMRGQHGQGMLAILGLAEVLASLDPPTTQMMLKQVDAIVSQRTMQDASLPPDVAMTPAAIELRRQRRERKAAGFAKRNPS